MNELKEVAKELKNLRHELEKIREVLNAKNKRSGRDPVFIDIREWILEHEDRSDVKGNENPGIDDIPGQGEDREHSAEETADLRESKGND